MKVVLRSTDMEPELLEYAQQHAMIALEVSNTDKVRIINSKGTATYLKVKLKEKDGSPNWHCIVGNLPFDHSRKKIWCICNPLNEKLRLLLHRIDRIFGL